ncbi:PilT/PilU family type 4a pilus ATPase [Tepidimonas taiwanensis]|uniref:Twitching mobility protein n=1 Tax=Tepidimonas taiwanensis TaxID=307486 RepID=A0A554X3H8_9BURK|nr:PilT/PilU family type 4a pilus ATPase [Tepidimonas taiwanensis]MDM7462663.1 PilT/PilU family type 4a pilus ATPase [Tepidimonas taiwanensis]TSE30392.1 Twitching mobility protein [Tepidimonas taiwanensis]UBQ06555.1 PilT/PilU family type 4a pilus ATPase [Tepidimonas taiwanensis]
MGLMEQLLRLMVEKNASDLYLSAGSAPLFKIHGNPVTVNAQRLPTDGPYRLLSEMVSVEDMRTFDRFGELNTAVSIPNMGRFRVSAMRQRGTCAVVVRYVNNRIPELPELGIPTILTDMIMAKRGLILIVGSTGSGKSTTIASLLEHRNAHSAGHILTIEDPIEYLFKNKKSIINQREVGTDTESLQTALKNAMRQAPDVIFIGEIRDRETMSHAIAYAQSGHLVVSTLHANNSYQALNRILNFYPAEVRSAMLSDLAATLKAIISQRLLRTVDGGRTPAVEVMVNTRLISELIEKGDFFGVREALEKSLAEESQTFEADIARLILSGRVTREEGLAHADSATNLLWRLQNDDRARATIGNRRFAEAAGGVGTGKAAEPSFDGFLPSTSQPNRV